MHQLLCGVEETIVIDGYTVEILEVTEQFVRFGVSTRGNARQVHQISLPRAEARADLSRQELTTR